MTDLSSLGWFLCPMDSGSKNPGSILGKTCVDTVLCFGTVRVQSVVENRLKDFRRATGIEKPAPQLYLWMRAFFME